MYTRTIAIDCASTIYIVAVVDFAFFANSHVYAEELSRLHQFEVGRMRCESHKFGVEILLLLLRLCICLWTMNRAYQPAHQHKYRAAEWKRNLA